MTTETFTLNGELLTSEEIAEITRMLGCVPEYPNERVALAAISKLLDIYRQVLMVLAEAAKPETGAPL